MKVTVLCLVLFGLVCLIAADVTTQDAGNVEKELTPAEKFRKIRDFFRKLLQFLPDCIKEKPWYKKFIEKLDCWLRKLELKERQCELEKKLEEQKKERDLQQKRLEEKENEIAKTKKEIAEIESELDKLKGKGKNRQRREQERTGCENTEGIDYLAMLLKDVDLTDIDCPTTTPMAHVFTTRGEVTSELPATSTPSKTRKLIESTKANLQQP